MSVYFGPLGFIEIVNFILKELGTIYLIGIVVRSTSCWKVHHMRPLYQTVLCAFFCFEVGPDISMHSYIGCVE